MVTLQDVAKKAGVASSTVSRVISGKAKISKPVCDKVNKAIADLKYRPNTNARALASRKTEMIGVITPNISTPFNGKIALGVEEAASKIKYKTLISNSFMEIEKELEAIDSFRGQGCENIIIHSLSIDSKVLIELAGEIRGLVILGRFIPEIANRCVWLDNVHGGQMAAQHLIDKGHKEIVIIADGREMQDPLERMKGFKQAIKLNDLSIEDDAVFSSQGIISDGQYLTRELLKSGKKFTALVTHNDLIAIGAMNELQDQGIRVPEEVSVIGFDNLRMSSICRPQLSTMNYPIQQMAKYATELSFELCKNNGEISDKTHLFIPTLIERKSVIDLNKI